MVMSKNYKKIKCFADKTCLIERRCEEKSKSPVVFCSVPAKHFIFFVDTKIQNILTVNKWINIFSSQKSERPVPSFKSCRAMFRGRRRQKLVLPIPACHSEKKLKRKPRCLTWTNVAFGALVPLMIGVATVALTIVNQKIDDQRRLHDENLAYLRRVQDQQLADELYYQGVYKTFVEDLADILFKANISFIDNEKKMKYIRTKTLTVLDELDWRHKSRLFFFLYETGLLSLPTSASENNNITNVSLDLTGANFVNISITSTPHQRFHFNKLHLLSVDLTNASFINGRFNQDARFTASSMFGIKFTHAKFECSKTYTGYDDPFGEIHISFDLSNLERSDFTSSHMCDASFVQANLAI